MGSVGSENKGSTNGEAYEMRLRQFDKTTFTNEGGGQWTLDTGVGGASILDESDSSAGGYGRMKAYSVRAWDSNYRQIGTVEIYGSLNAAKAAAKRKIKSTL